MVLISLPRRAATWLHFSTSASRQTVSISHRLRRVDAANSPRDPNGISLQSLVTRLTVFYVRQVDNPALCVSESARDHRPGAFTAKITVVDALVCQDQITGSRGLRPCDPAKHRLVPLSHCRHAVCPKSSRETDALLPSRTFEPPSLGELRAAELGSHPGGTRP